MNITELAKEPQLITVSLDKPALVEKYGEVIEFKILDRQPLDTFAKLSSMTEENTDQIAAIVESMILDDAGESVVKDGKTLPIDVLTEAMAAISTELGK